MHRFLLVTVCGPDCRKPISRSERAPFHPAPAPKSSRVALHHFNILWHNEKYNSHNNNGTKVCTHSRFRSSWPITRCLSLVALVFGSITSRPASISGGQSIIIIMNCIMQRASMYHDSVPSTIYVTCQCIETACQS